MPVSSTRRNRPGVLREFIREKLVRNLEIESDNRENVNQGTLKVGDSTPLTSDPLRGVRKRSDARESVDGDLVGEAASC